MRAKRLSVTQKKEIFEELVKTQDSRQMSIRESRDRVMKSHKISDLQLTQIEDEGMEKGWWPEEAIAAH